MTDFMKKIIRQGCDNNKVIFDPNSPGISKRLLYIMIRHMPKITTIWIPTFPHPEFIPDDWDMNNIATLLFYGKKIIFEPKLDREGEYVKYFLGELQGTLAKDTFSLIVGSNLLEEPSWENTILGSC
jgi:hypothetical protein